MRDSLPSHGPAGRAEELPPAARVRRRPLFLLLRIGVTAAAFYVLLTFEVGTPAGQRVPAGRVLLDALPHLGGPGFWRCLLVAVVIKAGGILAAMLRWHLLLIGQGIRFGFPHIAATFLIGRFLGTFLPSTLGLDAYRLYDASRFSGRTAAAAAALLVEKCAGIIGIVLCFLLTLPLGHAILGPRAGVVAAAAVPLALGVVTGAVLVAVRPGLLARVAARVPTAAGRRLADVAGRVAAAAGAYGDRPAFLAGAVVLGFLVHFLTAAMYYWTALAVGATHARFWEVAFASTVQILATVASPFTIAGEGVREIVQALLLAHRIGLPQSVLSAALGFWAAEALTLGGGLLYLARAADYRPVVRVDAPAGVARRAGSGA